METEDKVESLIEALELFCFRQNLSVKEFAEVIYGLSLTSQKIGVPIDKLPVHIEQLKNELSKLTREIEQIRLKKQAALRDYGVTLELIEDYEKNKPLYQKIQQLTQDLQKVKEERESLKRYIQDEEEEAEYAEKYEWSIAESVLDEAARKLGVSDESAFMKQLKEMVMDVYQRPTKYIEIIKQMMQVYNIVKNS